MIIIIIIINNKISLKKITKNYEKMMKKLKHWYIENENFETL
jgi:hypothetical protein